MANDKWPQVDRYLIQKLAEWAGSEIPAFRDGMTPHDCMVAMAERRGMERVINKLRAIQAAQVAEVKS